MGTPISALPAGTLASTQQFAVNDSGTTKRVTLATPLTDISTLQTQIAALQPRTALDQSGWSWTNQGTATVSQANSVVRLTAVANGSENLRIRSTTAPTTPYTIRAFINPNPMYQIDFHLAGICLRESATGKVVSCVFQTRGTGIPIFSWRKNTNATTISTGGNSSSLGYTSGMCLFIGDAGVGGNITLKFGFDGLLANATALLTEARNTFFTTGPDQVGIVIMNLDGGAGPDIGMSYLGWDQVS